MIGGTYLAGNFWAKPDGKGFSETAVDADGDGIADSEYKFENSIYADKLPLVSASQPQQPAVPTANFNMNTTEGPAPLSVQFTDTSKNAISLSWDFESDGKSDSTDKNPVHVYTKPGKYNVNLTAANEGRTASKTGTVTVTQANENKTSDNGSSGTENYEKGNEATATGDNPTGRDESSNSGTDSPEVENSETDSDRSDGSSYSSGNSHSSGGSSSIGGSPEPQENVEFEEILQTFITKDKKITFDFAKNTTCVVYTNFDSKKTVGKTTAIAELLKGKSSLTPELASGEIYKFFNVWVGNAGFAASENIDNPVIGFKVEKAWIQDKKIDPTSIKLNRYSNETWEQRPANQSHEDDKYLYYTAETEGFSFFAITGSTETGRIAVNDSQLDLQTEAATGNLGSENTDGMLRSEIAQALENRTSARSPGFETIYCIISLIALF
ncbi:MAG TPA: PGF-pre-PGF domain-containing protein, partial [Methanosarcina sp.]|nr:PGF-pre-PGF domain-containing protein [Methanosarcina sp.]